eukprot:m.4091 g.4091  ORF g.4091 m.4091 type:complete len:64 (-) comp2166_c0_seq1:929-1120(-)
MFPQIDGDVNESSQTCQVIFIQLVVGAPKMVPTIIIFSHYLLGFILSPPLSLSLSLFSHYFIP